MMFIANHLVLSEESSVRSMVGTTIHNLLIEISGFAGILESIEFAFTSAESFRAWQDYLCFHDLAVDAGMCLLFFRRPSFVCETWRDVFS